MAFGGVSERFQWVLATLYSTPGDKVGVNSNPGLRVNRSRNFSYIIFFSLLMFCADRVSDYSNSKQNAEEYKQKTSAQSYKTQIKTLAHPELA